MGLSRLRLIALGLLAASSAAAEDDLAHMARRDPDNLFDRPLVVRLVEAPSPAQHPEVKASLVCFSYPNFMVKELDYHEKGAERLSIAPVSGAPASATCSATPLPGEMVVTDDKGAPWSGYFMGVKGRFVVFDGNDAVDNAVPFVVVDGATGKTVLLDSANALHSVEASGDGLTLRYVRGFHAGCSLAAEPDACWRRIQEETRLTDAQRPNCAPYYELLFAQAGMMAESRQKLEKDILKELAADPSFLLYDVRADIRDGVAKVTPGDGPVQCRPQI